MKPRTRLATGQVWVTRDPGTRTPSRRVIQVAKGKVCYSTGGDSTRWCKRAAFRLWIRVYGAKVTRTTQKRSLTLRPLKAVFAPAVVRARAHREVAR